ncbi:MAG TPA: hypothetical protein PLP73_03995, partial [Candidatus Absconditabacterales bacterium]|nr:hypothetical protein [Candidatus Absconditabacterales bacterium]
ITSDNKIDTYCISGKVKSGKFIIFDEPAYPTAPQCCGAELQRWWEYCYFPNENFVCDEMLKKIKQKDGLLSLSS